MTGKWVVDSSNTTSSRDTEMEHLNNVPWWEAKLPRRLHKCKPQTRGWINWLTRVERCACGAINLNHSGWSDKNSRRK